NVAPGSLAPGRKQRGGEMLAGGTAGSQSGEVLVAQQRQQGAIERRADHQGGDRHPPQAARENVGGAALQQQRRGAAPATMSAGSSRSTLSATVWQIVSTSRWKCSVAFGLPVVPEVKAINATSSCDGVKFTNAPLWRAIAASSP